MAIIVFYVIMYARDMYLMNLYVDCLSLKWLLSEKNTGNMKHSMVSLSDFAYICAAFDHPE